MAHSAQLELAEGDALNGILVLPITKAGRLKKLIVEVEVSFQERKNLVNRFQTIALICDQDPRCEFLPSEMGELGHSASLCSGNLKFGRVYSAFEYEETLVKMGLFGHFVICATEQGVDIILDEVSSPSFSMGSKALDETLIDRIEYLEF